MSAPSEEGPAEAAAIMAAAAAAERSAPGGREAVTRSSFPAPVPDVPKTASLKHASVAPRTRAAACPGAALSFAARCRGHFWAKADFISHPTTARLSALRPPSPRRIHLVCAPKLHTTCASRFYYLPSPPPASSGPTSARKPTPSRCPSATCRRRSRSARRLRRPRASGGKAPMMWNNASGYDALHIPPYQWGSEGLHGL